MSTHYADAWKKYRIVVWSSWLLLPVFFALLFACHSLGIPTLVGLTLYALDIAYVIYETKKWRCPRCQSPKHGLFTSPLVVGRCKNCGLKRYADDDEKA